MRNAAGRLLILTLGGHGERIGDIRLDLTLWHGTFRLGPEQYGPDLRGQAQGRA
jgi:hypothetical protein